MTLVLNWAGYFLLIAAQLCVLLLFLRLVLDWVSVLMPELEIKPPALTVVNVIYRLTNPPLEYLRRFLPPLQLGNFTLDMGFVIAVIALLVLQKIANLLIYM